MSLVLSGISIVLAIISLIWSSKAQKLQNKVNELEYIIKQHEVSKLEKEAAEEGVSCVEARIIRMGQGNWRMKIWNSGKNTAYNVSARFEDDPSIMMFTDGKLPFEELEPMKSFELVIVVHSGSASKAKVLTEWDDSNGEHCSKSQMVDV